MKALGKALRFLFMALAGGILVLALLLFFAWLLFPRDFVRDVPEKALNRALPQFQWQVGTVRYDWPLALRLERVEALSSGQGTGGARGTGDTGTAAALFIDSLTLRPDLFFYLRERQWRGSFAAGLAGGTLQGQGTVQTVNEQQELAVSASLDALDLTALGWLSQMLERQVQGRLSGAIGTRLALRTAMPANLQARLRIADGTIPLRNPVLGHERLSFAHLSLQLAQEGRNLILKNGTLDSPLCLGEFAGQIALARPMAESAVSVRGTLQARPALFEHVRDRQDLQPLRLQAAQGPLVAMLSGTLHDPALAFERAALPPANLPSSLPMPEQGAAP